MRRKILKNLSERLRTVAPHSRCLSSLNNCPMPYRQPQTLNQLQILCAAFCLIRILYLYYQEGEMSLLSSLKIKE